MKPADLRSDPRLDRPEFIAASDKSRMMRLVEEFPLQFETSFERFAGESGAVGRSAAGESAAPVAAQDSAPHSAGSAALPVAHRVASPRRVWIAAMGGSAFAGDMVAAALGGADLEITVVRGYALPAAARAGDILLALSYSGDTAETLSTFEEAGARGLQRLAVSSGGRLGRLAVPGGVPWSRLPGGYPPRAAAGFAFAAAWELLRDAIAAEPAGPGPVSSSSDPVAVGRHLSAARAAWVPAAAGSGNLAKKIASWLDGRFPILYSTAGPGETAILRWRTQLNENAKLLCHTSVVPEMNHNEIVGWTDAVLWREQAAVIFLREGSEERATAGRLTLTREWLAEREIRTLEVAASGESATQRLWWLCHLGDYVSVYLAALLGIDPTPVTAIDELKKKIAEESQ